MTSAIKSFLILLAALPLMIYIGSEIGSDEYIVPLVAGLVIFSSLIFGLFFRSQRVECLVLVVLLAGYFIGSRGFAQLYLVQPLFVGELGMMVIFALMVIRYAVAREFIVAPHPLTWLIAAYLGFAFVRLCFDYGAYNLDAARDSAIAYYAVFFFAAYQLGRQPGTTAFIDRTMIWVIGLQGIVVLVAVFEPEWLELVTIRGVSPLLQKLDISATFCSLGLLFISIRSDLLRMRFVRFGMLSVLLVGMMLSGSRAAIVALGGAMVLTWIAGRRGFVALPLVVGIIGIVGTLVFGADSTGHIAAVRDQLISIVDVSGTYQYQTERGDEKQADNNFRRALWESIYKQTIEDKAGILGKGFGYNFIPAFQDEYRAGTWDTLRSAHNYYITVFGRMGLLGFGLFVAITIEIIRGGVRAALALRRGERRDAQSLAYWCAAWAILISGGFGVVLEGPMGAIPFWSFLGLALSSDDRSRLEARTAEAEHEPLLVSPHARPDLVPRPAMVR